MTRTYRNTYLSFLFLSFALSSSMWFHVRTTFDAVTLGGVVITAFFTVFSVALFILSLLLFTWRETFGIFIAFCVAFLIFLPFHMPYLIAVALALLIFAYAETEIRNGANNRLTVSFYSLLVYGVPTLLTALALLYSFVGYFYPFNLENARVTSSSFSIIVPQIEKIVSTKFPYYQSGMNIDEFLTASARESALSQFGSIPQQAEAIIKNEVAKERATLSKQFDVALTGNEKLEDMLAIMTNSYLQKYLGSYKNLVPFVVAISVFLSIKSFGFILDRFAVFIAWIATKALIASGVMVKKKITTEKETLTIA